MIRSSKTWQAVAMTAVAGLALSACGTTDTDDGGGDAAAEDCNFKIGVMGALSGVRYTDMSPFRAATVERLRALDMREMTFGWNLEMQMKAAAGGLRVREIAVDHRCRRGGVSKVSGNLAAGLRAAWVITTTFVRLSASLKKQSSLSEPTRP